MTEKDRRELIDSIIKVVLMTCVAAFVGMMIGSPSFASAKDEVDEKRLVHQLCTRKITLADVLKYLTHKGD